MKITDIIWLPRIIEKLSAKHGVAIDEAEHVIRNTSRFYFVEAGVVSGEDVYLAAGQTSAGRYLIVFFIYKKTKSALILSARNMTVKERKRYASKKP